MTAESSLQDKDSRVVRFNGIVGAVAEHSSELQRALWPIARPWIGWGQVDLQWLLTSLTIPAEVTEKLAQLAWSTNNPSMMRALALCNNPAQAMQLSSGLLDVAGTGVSFECSVQRSTAMSQATVDTAGR